MFLALSKQLKQSSLSQRFIEGFKFCDHNNGTVRVVVEGRLGEQDIMGLIHAARLLVHRDPFYRAYCQYGRTKKPFPMTTILMDEPENPSYAVAKINSVVSHLKARHPNSRMAKMLDLFQNIDFC